MSDQRRLEEAIGWPSQFALAPAHIIAPAWSAPNSPSAESRVFPDDAVAWPRDPDRVSSAPTDVEAQAIELAGFPARDDHRHHLPGKVVDRDAILPTTARLRELAPAAREWADLDLVLRAVKVACAVVAQPTTIPVADIPLTARRGLSPRHGQILERLLAGSYAEAHRLTPREWEVLHLLVQRASDPEIAVALGVALSTARSWSASVRSKLGVRSRRALSPRPLRNV